MPLAPGSVLHQLRATIEATGEFMLFVVHTAASLVRPPPPRLRALLYQCYLQGVRALGLALVAGALTGMALAFQFGTGLKRFGATSALPQLTSLGLFRELIPVMTGLVIGGRIAAGIAAEIGTMAVTEQLDAIRALGADPIREVVAPRVFSAVLVLPLLTVFADLVALGGAITTAAIENGIPGRYFVYSASEFLIVNDFLSGLEKAAVFGGAVSIIGCWCGVRATGGADGVGRATTAAVVQGAITVIISDYLLSRILAPLLAKGPGL